MSILKKACLVSLVALLAACGLLACGTDGETPVIVDGDPNATDDFVSAAPNANSHGSYDNGEASGDGDAAAPGDDQDKAGDAAREIVESDLFKVIGNHIYALNSFRGLAVIDFSDPAKMTVVGRLRIAGSPFEMFVRDGIAVVFATGLSEEKDRSYRQISKIYSISIANPEHPELLKETTMDGVIFDDRLVGDVVYVLATVYPWMNWCGGGDTTQANQGSVEALSLNIADARAPKVVERLSLDKAGQAVYINQDFMYVASSDYYWGNYERQGSTVRIVDISDPAGHMRERGTFQAAGWVQDRFKMNEDGKVLAVASNSNYSWNGVTTFETFDVSNPDQPQRLAALPIMENEALQATRFEGRRAYVVTFRNTDPLFVVDWQNAAAPLILGNLEIPGWSTHLEIRGTKLYGVGIDNSDNWKAKVALYDIADPTRPIALSTIALGEGYSYSQANWDWKAFGLYDSLNLLLVPTTEYPKDAWWGAAVNKLNLITIGERSLTLEGAIESSSPIMRGFVAGDYLASLSMTTLQLFDYSDRKAPKIKGTATLASYVGDLTDCGTVLCSTNDNWVDSSVRLKLFSKTNPGDVPFWQSENLEGANSSWGNSTKVFYRGGKAFVLTNRSGGWGYYGEGDRVVNDVSPSQPRSRIYGFDLANPQAPAALGQATLEDLDDGDTNQHWYSSSVTYADSLSDNQVLVGLRARWVYDANYTNSRYQLDFLAFDLNKLDAGQAPLIGRQATTSPLFSNYTIRPILRGTTAWLPSCETAGNDAQKRPYLRCYALALDLADTSAVRVAAKINVPGQVVEVSADQKTVYTLDSQFAPSSSPDYFACKTSLNVLAIRDGRAQRVARQELFTNDTCYYAPHRVEADGDVSGGEDSEGTVTPEGGGTSTTPKALASETYTYSYYLGLYFDAGRVFVANTQYSYNYDSSDCYSYADRYTLSLRILDAQSGTEIKTIEVAGASSLLPVIGGGFIASGTSWRGGSYQISLSYISTTGEVKVLPMPQSNMSYFWLSSSPVRQGSTLFLPMGWEGVYTLAL